MGRIALFLLLMAIALVVASIANTRSILNLQDRVTALERRRVWMMIVNVGILLSNMAKRTSQSAQ